MYQIVNDFFEVLCLHSRKQHVSWFEQVILRFLWSTC